MMHHGQSVQLLLKDGCRGPKHDNTEAKLVNSFEGDNFRETSWGDALSHTTNGEYPGQGARMSSIVLSVHTTPWPCSSSCWQLFLKKKCPLKVTVLIDPCCRLVTEWSQERSDVLLCKICIFTCIWIRTPPGAMSRHNLGQPPIQLGS